MKVKNRVLSVFMVLSLILCALTACAQEKSSEEQSGYTIDNIRDYVVGIDEEMELDNGTRKAVINFDNAATTPALQPVVDEVDEQRHMLHGIRGSKNGWMNEKAAKKKLKPGLHRSSSSRSKNA